MPLIRGKQIIDGEITEAKLASALETTLIRTDGSQAFAANQSLGGFKLTSVGTGTAATDAVNKAQLDDAVVGLKWKEPARVATTANINLTGLQTIDGIVLVADDRVLVKDQDDTCENGIFVAAAGAWVRATDADNENELISAAVFVRQGSVNADRAYVQTSDNLPGISGSSCSSSSLGAMITWVQFTSSGGAGAGAGLVQNGADLDVNVGDGIVITTDRVTVDLEATGAGTGGLRFVGVTPNGKLGVDPGNGITLTSNGVEVLANGTSIDVSASGVKSAVPRIGSIVSGITDQDNLAGAVTTGDGDLATTATTGLPAAPSGGSRVQVLLNGLEVLVGNDASSGEAYFGQGNTITARALTALVAGDTLRWRGSVAGFELDTTDRFAFRLVNTTP